MKAWLLSMALISMVVIFGMCLRDGQSLERSINISLISVAYLVLAAPLSIVIVISILRLLLWIDDDETAAVS